MRIGEQGTSRRRELLAAVFVNTDVEPCATVGLIRIAGLRAGLSNTLRGTLILCDVFVTTGGTPDDAIRPAHFLDVLKTLFVSGELYDDFSDADRLGMDSRGHEPTLAQFAFCVK